MAQSNHGYTCCFGISHGSGRPQVLGAQTRPFDSTSYYARDVEANYCAVHLPDYFDSCAQIPWYGYFEFTQREHRHRSCSQRGAEHIDF